MTLGDTTGKGLERRARRGQPLHKWWFSDFPDGGREVKSPKVFVWQMRTVALMENKSVKYKSLGLTVGFSRTVHHVVVCYCILGDGTNRHHNPKWLLFKSFKSEWGAVPGPQCSAAYLLLKWLVGDPTNQTYSSSSTFWAPVKATKESNHYTDWSGSEAVKLITVLCATGN